ncbi:MAG: DinB family protein [Acidobacteria bacterium]|nr:DinB family protein [Acidobacteriota bacterium]
MNRAITAALALVIFLTPSIASAQNPWMSSIKAQHERVRDFILETAETVPEELYSFKATPDARSIGQLLGHIADATTSMCANAGAIKVAPLGAEKSMTTKAQLTKALQDAYAVCDKVIAGMTDAQAGETTKFYIGGMSTRGMIIGFNTTHSYEHYGNLVTYMRLNKIVPPSSGN